MEAEVAPKSTTLAFVLVSALEAWHFLGQAFCPVAALIQTQNSGPMMRTQYLSVALPTEIAVALSAAIAIILALLFARRLVKMREVRPEPNPRVWATLGGCALLVLALQCVSWGTRPLLTWAQESMGYISYDQGGWVLEIAVMSKGLGPAFLLILAGLLIVVCFGMTRPRMAFLDEEHEVWGKPEPE